MEKLERAKQQKEIQQAFDKRVLRYIKIYASPFSSLCTDINIAKFFQISERYARLSVARLRKTAPILNFQDGKGYIIPDNDTAEGQALIARWKRQEFSRAMKILAGLKGASMAQGNPEQLKLELYEMVDDIMEGKND